MGKGDRFLSFARNCSNKHKNPLLDTAINALKAAKANEATGILLENKMDRGK